MTDLEPLEVRHIMFSRRPSPLPADLRPRWMMTSIILVLHRCCREQRSWVPRVHALTWALLSERTRDAFLRVLNQELSPDAIIVRFDPSVDRAIDLAVGEGFTRRLEKGRIELTPAGRDLAAAVEAEGIFREELAFLSEVGRRASERVVDELLRWRGIS